MTTTGDLPMASAKAAPLPISASVLKVERITSTSGSCATGLKKCSPISRAGSLSASAMRSSSIEDVLVAMMAPGLSLSSRPLKMACLTSSFSTTASITTSARATPLPLGSASSRSMAASTSRFFFSRFLNSALPRSSAGWIRAMSRSCSVTLMPRSAHQAAISPPITPAPITCTRANLTPLVPCFLRLSEAKNTRRRLVAVGLPISGTKAAISPWLIACQVSPCFSNRSIRACGAG